MKIKFMGILTVEAALKAAENDPDALQYAPQESFTEQVALKAAEKNPDALQYVLNFDIFKKIALKLNLKIET